MFLHLFWPECNNLSNKLEVKQPIIKQSLPSLFKNAADAKEKEYQQ
jgi:hypothetical protein